MRLLTNRLNENARSTQSRRFKITILIWLLAATWATTVALLHGHVTHSPPLGEEPAVGIHLARGEGFLSPVDRSPFAPPTMWCPPLYPAVIGFVYGNFGIATPTALVMLLIFNSLCFGGFVAAMDRLAVACLPRGAGPVTVVLLCLHPQFLHFVEDDWDTYLGMALFGWTLVLAQSKSISKPAQLWRTSIALGVLMGMTSLANAAMVLAYPVIALWPLCAAPLRRRIIPSLLLLASFCLTLLPWTLHLHDTVGGWHYVRGSLPSSLWIGNRPTSSGWADPETMSNIPYFNAHEAYLMLHYGELEYDRICQSRFVADFRNAPQQFWLRCGRRIGYLFLSKPDAPTNYPMLPNWKIGDVIWPKTLLNAIVAAIGVTGLITTWRTHRKARWIIAAMLLSELAYVPAVILDRYTLLLRALLIMMTASLAMMVFDRRRIANATAAPSPRSPDR